MRSLNTSAELVETTERGSADRYGYSMAIPPFTCKVVPLMYAASSLAK